MITEYLLKNFLLIFDTDVFKIKTLVKILTVIIILLSFALGSLNISFSNNGNKGKIDIFTQKEPYSGKGLGMPSDTVDIHVTVKIKGTTRNGLMLGFSLTLF